MKDFILPSLSIPSQRCLFVIVAALFLTGCRVVQNGAIIGANKALARHQYDYALGKLSEAESYQIPTPTLQAQISFLRGRSYEGLGRYPEAIGSYQYVVEKYPDSVYAYQARERLKVLNPKGKH